MAFIANPTARRGKPVGKAGLALDAKLTEIKTGKPVVIVGFDDGKGGISRGTVVSFCQRHGLFSPMKANKDGNLVPTFDGTLATIAVVPGKDGSKDAVQVTVAKK